MTKQKRQSTPSVVHYCTALILILISFSGLSFASSIQNIPAYTLRYAISFQGHELGELQISLKHRNQKVFVHGETFPNALAEILGDGKVIETIEYVQHGDSLRLASLTEQIGKNNPSIKELRIDYPNNRLFTDDEQISISSSDQIDAYTFPLLSIMGLSDFSDRHEVKLVSAQKIRSYRYQPPVHEMIHNRAGSFNTLKQSRTRLNDSKTIALWVTESAPIMPVQIQVDSQDGHQILISLISIEQ